MECELPSLGPLRVSAAHHSVIRLTVLPLGAALVGYHSGTIGEPRCGGSAKQGQADEAGLRAEQLAQQSVDLWSNLQTPTLDRTPLVAQKWLEDFKPETYDPYIGQLSQMSDDPAMKALQQTALDQYGQLAKGGLQPADLIALDQIQRAQAGAATSQSAAAADALMIRLNSTRRFGSISAHRAGSSTDRPSASCDAPSGSGRVWRIPGRRCATRRRVAGCRTERYGAGGRSGAQSNWPSQVRTWLITSARMTAS